MKILRYMLDLLVLVSRDITSPLLRFTNWMLYSKSIWGKGFRMYVTTIMPVILVIDLFKYSGLSEEYLFPIVFGVVMLGSVLDIAWWGRCKEDKE